MSIPDELRNIRDHLRSGRFGQREVWEQQLENAAAKVEYLREKLQAERLRTVELCDHVWKLRTEVERLQAVVKAHEADNELRYPGEIPL